MDILQAFFATIGVGCVALAIFVWLHPSALHALQGILAAREAYIHAGRKAAAQRARKWSRTSAAEQHRVSWVAPRPSGDPGGAGSVALARDREAVEVR